MTIRLGHINIKTPFYEQTLTFYETLLGLHRTPALTMADQERNAWLSNEDGQPIIHVNTAESAPSAGAMPTLDHVAFECDDLSGIFARLDMLRVKYTHVSRPEVSIEQVFFVDPNGIKIELTFDKSLVDL